VPNATHGPDAGCGEQGACRVLPTRSPLPTVEPTAWDVRRRRSIRRAAAARSSDACCPERMTTLVLDVGGVVIPSLFESVGIAGFPTGALTGEPAWARVQRGETSEREYWQAVAAERPGIDIHTLWRDCSRVRDEVRGVLDAIVSRVQVVAFTNDMTHFFGADWPARFPEMASFDWIVEAAQLGVHKPDPEAFLALARLIGEPPERCLFVDDLVSNLDGARHAGMQARLFDVRDPVGSIEGMLSDLALSRAEVPRAQHAFSSSGGGWSADRGRATPVAAAVPEGSFGARRSGRAVAAFRVPRP